MPHCVQYMNNCICAERGFDQVKDAEIIGKIMEKSAAAVGAFEFDGLKLDSCSQFNNLTWYSPILKKHYSVLSVPVLLSSGSNCQDRLGTEKQGELRQRSGFRRWSSLLNKTGRPILIENCHQGGLDPPGTVRKTADFRAVVS